QVRPHEQLHILPQARRVHARGERPGARDGGRVNGGARAAGAHAEQQEGGEQASHSDTPRWTRPSCRRKVEPGWLRVVPHCSSSALRLKRGKTKRRGAAWSAT